MHVCTFFRSLKSSLTISILLCFCILDCQPRTEPPPQPPVRALYNFDWNNAARFAITGALSQIPEVGSLLSGLVHIFWPSPQEDVWSEIKDQVQTLITQNLDDFKYSDIQTALGTLGGGTEDGSGLIGVLQNYLNSKMNGQNPSINWGSANTAFIDSLSLFQQSGFELFSLPLFAQFANLHLSLLRDGVIAGYTKVNVLQQRIVEYTAWTEKWFRQGYYARLQQANLPQGPQVPDAQYFNHSTLFNYVNAYVRHMQTSVMDFSYLWQYFDPIKYPNGTSTNNPAEIFESASESYFSIGCTDSSCLSFNPKALVALPSQPAGYIENIILGIRAQGTTTLEQVQVIYDAPSASGTGGIGVCKASDTAYPISCICDTSASPNQCYIVVSGVPPVAGESFANLNLGCCTQNGDPATIGSSTSCLVADSFEGCQQLLVQQTVKQTAQMGIGNVQTSGPVGGGGSINPIVAVSGQFSTSPDFVGVLNVGFTYRNSVTMGPFPGSTNFTGPTVNFSIDHAGDKYYLSSIFVINESQQYAFPSDLIFGWKQRP